MRYRPICLLALFFVLFSASFGAAQTQFSKEVQEFVRVQSPVVALEHVRVIDGTGAAARADQTIIISGGKIQAMGASGSVTVPEGANRMDFTGYSALPGLVGMHDHLFYPAQGGVYRDMHVSFPRLYLASGVTTIRTTGNVDPYVDFMIKRMVDAGAMAGPRINVTAPYLEGKGNPLIQLYQLSGPEDARRTVNYWAEEGAGSFKAYNYLTRAELKAAIDEAHRHHLKLTGHLCSIGFREAAELGIDNLEHGLGVDTEFFPGKQPDICPNANQASAAAANLETTSEPIQAMIRDLVKHHVAITSTLPVFEQFVASRPDVPQKVLDMLAEDSRKAYQDNRVRIAQRKNSPWPLMFQRELEFERAFAKAGGVLLGGLDPTGIGGIIAGFGDHREVELLVEAGFTPLEAIKIQTLNGAEFLGEQSSIGSLVPGKLADIMIVKGDPSSKIEDIENVELVFKGGIGFDSKKLIESVKGKVGNL